MEYLAPFGEGNRQPLFSSTGLSLAGSLRRLGSDGQHLSFFVRGEKSCVRAIAFGMGDCSAKLERHRGTVSLAYEPQFDTYNGTNEVQLVVRDIRLDS